jgi:hypothetical protein
MLDGDRINHLFIFSWGRRGSMAKTKKRPAKKRPAKGKASAKRTKKSAARKPAKHVAKSKATAKKKMAGGSTPARPAPGTGLDEDNKKPTSKTAPAIMPNEPDLEDEEMGEGEIEMGSEGEMEEDMEEDLSLDDDEEDVDYLEKSEDLLDDSDEYRH